jgi:uncharacterized membrane protein YdjX (TVP38/TMEM64 family)
MTLARRRPAVTRILVRWLFAGAGIAAALACVVIASTYPGGPAAVIGAVEDTVRHAGHIGVAGFWIVALGVALSGALPASLVGMAAGAVYGVGLGFVLTAAANLVGAGVAFAFSRSLLRGTVGRWVARHELACRIDAAVARDGWKLVCLLRLSPVMPFSATSYLLGVSSVRGMDYAAGTLASLPPLLGYVFLGSVADAGLSAWTRGINPLQSALLSVGVAATLVAGFRVCRHVLDRRLAPVSVQPAAARGP